VVLAVLVLHLLLLEPLLLTLAVVAEVLNKILLKVVEQEALEAVVLVEKHQIMEFLELQILEVEAVVLEQELAQVTVVLV
jgi:hypothetical protein